MLNLDYCYPFQKERYGHFWNLDFPCRENLKVHEYQNAYVLPQKYVRPFPPQGRGGALDEKANFLTESCLFYGNQTIFGGKYGFETDPIWSINENCIYLGFLNYHWGHFLIDSSTRLYAKKLYPDYKFVYIVDSNFSRRNYPDQIWRFLELLNISYYDIYFITVPAKVRKLVIPEPAYLLYSYYSKNYLEIFDEVSANISPQICPCKKVHFSKKNYKKNSREIGFDAVDSIFSAAGHKIIYPEEESLDNQIGYLKNSTEISGLLGTFAHNLLFIGKQGKNIYLVGRNNHLEQAALESCRMREHNIAICDFYTSPLPGSFTKSPSLFAFNFLCQKFIGKHKLPLDISAYTPLHRKNIIVFFMKWLDSVANLDLKIFLEYKFYNQPYYSINFFIYFLSYVLREYPEIFYNYSNLGYGQIQQKLDSKYSLIADVLCKLFCSAFSFPASLAAENPPQDNSLFTGSFLINKGDSDLSKQNILSLSIKDKLFNISYFFSNSRDNTRTYGFNGEEISCPCPSSICLNLEVPYFFPLQFSYRVLENQWSEWIDSGTEYKLSGNITDIQLVLKLEPERILYFIHHLLNIEE